MIAEFHRHARRQRKGVRQGNHMLKRPHPGTAGWLPAAEQAIGLVAELTGSLTQAVTIVQILELYATCAEAGAARRYLNLWRQQCVLTSMGAIDSARAVLMRGSSRTDHQVD